VIIYLPALLFSVGAIGAYARAGWIRTAGTLAMVAAVAWSLALLVAPAALALGIGPLAATLILRRPAARVPSSFEILTRRSVTMAAAALVAVFAASRLPVGENSVLLSAVPWFLAAVGAAWFISPVDEPERMQGEVLMIAGAAAVLLDALPAGLVTAGVAGAMAIMPIAGERWRVPGRLRPAISAVLLALALVAGAIAAIGSSVAPVAAFDFSLNVGGPILVATAILLVAGAAVGLAGCEWAALLGVLAVAAAAPSVQWAALGALVAVAGGLDRRGERMAWLAVAMLALTSLLTPLTLQPWSPRLIAVLFAAALVVIMPAAAGGMLRSLVLPATVFAVVLAIGTVPGLNLSRLQWVAAVGAVLLVARALLARLVSIRDDPVIIRDVLIAGLLLLAIVARDPLGLGALAVALLVLDLALVRVDEMPPKAAVGWAARIITLARSNWPPAVTFAGGALAVTAALQASLPLGLLAALLLAGLQVAPLLDRHALAPAPARPLSRLAWIGPVLSVACGIAPALVLRMLRV
jgi:hypothetical protein